MKKASFNIVILIFATFRFVSTNDHDHAHDEHYFLDNSSLNSHDTDSSGMDTFHEIVQSVGGDDRDVLDTEDLEKLFKNLHLKSCATMLTTDCNSVSLVQEIKSTLYGR